MGPELRGRRTERRALGQLIADAREGRSAVLVLRGEAGVGKTCSCWDMSRTVRWAVAWRARWASSPRWSSPTPACISSARRCWGTWTAFLARSATRSLMAFGMTQGEPPDRFMVGLAVLSLVSEVVEEKPLICLVDDAQWLDRVSAQTLAFVARRLLAEPVALVFAVREPSDERELLGLPELVVRGLSESAARALLDSVISGPMDERVRDRIVAETRGNPLALLELPRGLSAAELAFGFGLPDAMPLESRIEQGFLRRLEPLSGDARRLLLVAAVEPVGDEAVFWRAVRRLGLGPGSAAEAETTGLIETRSQDPIPTSARALGGVSLGVRSGAPGHAPGARRRHRSGA